LKVFFQARLLAVAGMARGFGRESADLYGEEEIFWRKENPRREAGVSVARGIEQFELGAPLPV
jgi:hypothetical protein